MLSQFSINMKFINTHDYVDIFKDRDAIILQLVFQNGLKPKDALNLVASLNNRKNTAEEIETVKLLNASASCAYN